jgi:hypothetical protein
MKLQTGPLKQVSAFLDGLEKLSRDTGVWLFPYQGSQLETVDSSIVDVNRHNGPETGCRGYQIESNE